MSTREASTPASADAARMSAGGLATAPTKIARGMEVNAWAIPRSESSGPSPRTMIRRIPVASTVAWRYSSRARLRSRATCSSFRAKLVSLSSCRCASIRPGSPPAEEEKSAASRERRSWSARARRIARAPQKLEPHAFSIPLDLPDQDGADLPRGPYVGAAAGAPIEIPDGYDPEVAVAVGRLSEPGGRLGVLEAHVYLAILSHDLIGARFHLGDLSRSHGPGLQVQRRGLPPEVNPHGEVSEQLRQHRREQVLAGMLLHMVEAAGPVYLAPGALARKGLGQEVRYPFPLVHDVGDLDTPKPAGVEWLAPGGGIECGSVEVDSPPIFGPVDNGRLEVVQVAVGIVEPLGHGNREPRRRSA